MISKLITHNAIRLRFIPEGGGRGSHLLHSTNEPLASVKVMDSCIQERRGIMTCDHGDDRWGDVGSFAHAAVDASRQGSSSPLPRIDELSTDVVALKIQQFVPWLSLSRAIAPHSSSSVTSSFMCSASSSTMICASSLKVLLANNDT
jgi:hypothetical protein